MPLWAEGEPRNVKPTRAAEIISGFVRGVVDRVLSRSYEPSHKQIAIWTWQTGAESPKSQGRRSLKRRE